MSAQQEWLDSLSEASNYTRWILESVATYVQGDVLEVGCGVGTYTTLLAKKCQSVTAVDIDHSFSEAAKAATKAEKNVTVLCADATKDLPDGQFDTIIMLDVLEHIEDDAGFIKALKDKLRPNGRIILKIPALPKLLNSMDHAVGHYRRYDTEMLHAVASKAGMKVVGKTAFNALGIAGWWWNGLKNRDVAPASQIAGFDRIVPVARLLDYLSFKKIGLSLVVAFE